MERSPELLTRLELADKFFFALRCNGKKKRREQRRNTNVPLGIIRGREVCGKVAENDALNVDNWAKDMIEHTRQADDRVCYSWLDYRLDCCYTQESKPQVIIYTRTHFVSLAFCMEHEYMEQLRRSSWYIILLLFVARRFCATAPKLKRKNGPLR